MVKPELMEIFKEEAQELIDKMRKELTSFEEWGKMPDRAAPLRELFRFAHILKGVSSQVEFGDLKKMAEALMKVFSAAKDGPSELKPLAISLLSEGIQACQNLFEQKEVGRFQELLEKLANLSVSLRRLK
ncbi:MAG: Hpt domain-containing protein [Elusimicrobia bacterium]|nr:Hpt domain-containing protein [Candidatus Obscuribacterium magneticum]